MYDKLLAKNEFVCKLKEAGYSDDEISINWHILENFFEAQMFKNAYAKLPKDKVVEIVGKSDLTVEEAPEAVRKIGAYLKEHSGEYDFNNLVIESARQAIDLMKNYLSK